MKKLVLLLSLALGASAYAGFTQQQDFRPATPAELAMKNATGAPAAILDWVRLDDHPASITSEYYRIKIFGEEGKKFADVEIPYMPGYPASQRVSDVSARTIRPDGTIVPFDGKIYDKVLYKSRRRQWKARAFSLAGVEPGSIIEYRYQVRSRANLLFDEAWILQREIPLVHAKLMLRPYNTRGQYTSFFTYVGLPAGKIPELKGAAYNLEVENIAPFTDEAYAPPQESLAARVNFYYTDPHSKPDSFWTVNAIEWTKSIEKFIGNEKPYAAQVQKGADPMTTLKNVYAKAQSLKNLSYVSESEEEESANGAAVLAKGAGYAHEITRAFVGMARAAGFDAYVMKVAPRSEGFFSPQLLDASQVSEEIAAVVLPGMPPKYFDPGTPGAPFGVVAWDKTNAPGLRMSKGVDAIWSKIDDTRPDEAVLQRKADLRVNGDVVEGTVTVTYNGQEALRWRSNTWSDDDETRRKAFEDDAKSWFPDGATVKLEDLGGHKTHEGPVVAKYSVKVPVAMAGSRLMVPLSFFAAAQKNPFAPATRTHPVYFNYPRRTEDDVTLTLPENLLPAAVPPDAKYDVGAMKYSNESMRDGRTVTFKRSMTIDALLIDAKHYNALRNFYNAVVAADQRPLLLVPVSSN